MTPETWAVLATGLGLPLVSLLGLTLMGVGRLRSDLDNIKASIQAIHVRFDGFKKEFRETKGDFLGRLETNSNNFEAELLSHRDALVKADLLDVAVNGRPR